MGVLLTAALLGAIVIALRDPEPQNHPPRSGCPRPPARQRNPHPLMNAPLLHYLTLSALLFSVGLAGALLRRNAVLVLIGVELMLNAANLNFIAFWRYGAHPEAVGGVMFAIFSIAIAAAEAAVGLALVIAIYRHRHTAQLEQFDSLRG